VVAESQTQTILKQGVMASDTCTVSFARTPNAAGHFSEYPVSPSAVYFCPGGAEFDLHRSGASESVYFSFAQADFLADAMVLDERYWSARSGQFFAARRIGQLAGFADLLLQRPQGPDARWPPDRLARIITANALAAFDLSEADGLFEERNVLLRRRALRVVRRARNFIDHALDSHQHPTIVDVCRSTGVSQRNLQYCFLDALALTPVAYLRSARLHRARAELRDGATAGLTVGDVAARWGFWHLSKFAHDYQKLFGELPSETLRQRR
jgi:AraC family ethanolamine operon transcriptional activator